MKKSIFKMVVAIVLAISLISNVAIASDEKLVQGGMSPEQTIGMVSGGTVGGVAGVAGSVTAIMIAGSSSGAAGAAVVTTGLFTIGGGSMVGGLIVCTGGTALLVMAGGYAGYKAVQWFNTPD